MRDLSAQRPASVYQVCRKKRIISAAALGPRGSLYEPARLPQNDHLARVADTEPKHHQASTWQTDVRIEKTRRFRFVLKGACIGNAGCQFLGELRASLERQQLAGRSPDGQHDFFAFCAFWFARIASVMDRLEATVAMSALGQIHN